jgi:hypothetical protein
MLEQPVALRYSGVGLAGAGGHLHQRAVEPLFSERLVLRLGGWSALLCSRVARRPLERVVGHLLPARLDTGEV